jgi:hypothetical protein
LFREKSTAGWWLISQANRAPVYTSRTHSMHAAGGRKQADLHALICWWYVNMILTDALVVAVVYVDPIKSSRTYILLHFR